MIDIINEKKIIIKKDNMRIKHPNKLNPIPIDKLSFWFCWSSRHPHANPPKNVIIIAPYPNWKDISVLLTSPPIIHGISENVAKGKNPMYPYVDFIDVIFNLFTVKILHLSIQYT